MSRKRIPSPKRKSRTLEVRAKKLKAVKPKAAAKPTLQFHRFIGVSLGGGKTDKTAMAVIEYYPVQKKIFLSRLFDKIKTEGDVSADLQLHRLITETEAPVESVAFDVPLQLPKCLLCNHRGNCPGYENCEEPEIQWMWKHHRSQPRKKSPPRLFTPYTERCVEQYLQTELEEPFHLQHALGSNNAPLTARAQYVSRRLKLPLIEVFPKLSLWRIGNALNLPKSQLRVHRHWEAGPQSRQLVLSKMKNLAFIYEQDTKTLIESPHAFDAFICATTGLLSFLGHTEPRPKGFPKKESWLEIPKKLFAWPA